ncbi:MAG: VanZ family protein [Lachnospiraceae bacterium]|nr:VanZ family protein [Lachnospiraceae bacterium]
MSKNRKRMHPVKAFFRAVLKPFSFIPAILVMVMIFHFSSQPGRDSDALSRAVSHKIVVAVDRVLDRDWDDGRIEHYTDKINYYVRKGAHVTEYFILAACVALPLYVYGIRGIALILLAGAICAAYAGLDEYHQSFVAGRGPSLRDVGIDCIGVLPGILLTMMVGAIGRKTIFRPLAR